MARHTRCYMVVFGAFADFDRFMADYQSGVGNTIEKYGGRYVLVGESMEVLEGEFNGKSGSVISVWQNRSAALKFWNSPEYVEIRERRAGVDNVQVVLIEAPMLDSPG